MDLKRPTRELVYGVRRHGGGEFEVVLGAGVTTSKVPNSDDFVDINLGEFLVNDPGTYRIIITGLNLEDKDGELMNLRSLTLKKKD